MSIAQDRLARIVIVRRGLSRLVFLTTAAPGAFSPRNLPLSVRWSFLLFIALIAIEVSSLTKLSGFLFFAIYFFYHNPLSRKRSFPPIPPAMAWFMVYVAVYAMNGLFLPTEYLSQFFTGLFTLVQVIIFLWIASDILKEEKMAKKALLAYSIASVILALGFILSLPGFGVTGEVGSERASAIGVSANLLGGIMALAMVVVLGLWLNLAHKRLVTGVWMFVSMLALSIASVSTGSRVGFLMSMIGLSVYLVPYSKNRWRMSNVIVGIIAIAGFAYIAATSVVFSSRWREFSEAGDVAGRDKIFEEALDMISERPLVGWQPIQFKYELGRRTYTRAGRDAHNTYLHVLMEVVVVGAVPFLIGLWLCGQGAWKARNRNLGLLPLALLVAVLAGSMGTNWMNHKTLWFVLAVSVAAGGERKRSGMILVGRPMRMAYKQLLNVGKVSDSRSQQRSPLDQNPTAKD